MKTYLNKILCHSRKSGNLYRFQIKFGMTNIILILILFLALFFRLYGLGWDQGQHLHPDERFLTMVLTSMKIPSTFFDYLNPNLSTLNPYNIGYSFFVYGTFPLFLTKIAGLVTANNDYWNIHLVGRLLSGLFDTGTVILVYLITKKIYSKSSLITPLIAAFLYSILVLPIQLSHFFAVDTFLNFFIVLSFYLLVKILNTKYLILNTLFLSISYGLALACKISALYFLPIIGLGFFFLALKYLKSPKLLKILMSGVIFFLVSYFVFRLAQPSFFSSANFLNLNPNPQFIKNINELKSFNSDSWFPPAVQWQSTKPILFPLKNMIFWGMGLPLGIISILSVGYTIVILLSCYLAKNKKILNTEYLILNTLIIIWILGFFIFQGLQFCKTMRYLLPIYPFLAILSANFLSKIDEYFFKKISRPLFLIANCLLLITLLIYPLSFLSIYSRPVTRVSASEWIYKNIPAGPIVINEEWDDGLPLGLPNYNINDYKWEQVMMYDFDTPEKWQRLNKSLEKADYIFLTSNRAYGSTMKVPSKYPQTIKYYQSLFDNTGDFKKVAGFTSYPTLHLPFIHSCIFVSPPNITSGVKELFGGLIRVDSCKNGGALIFIDDSAEEAFTVYDHPKVMIFKKSR